MFLKSVEIKGFKSFADKMKVDFEPAITGVIGPNGSGKSNISDAIRWVLGEQSAKTLRGAKMEDIIFAGSDQRRALGIAEVSLTLDNSDGALPIDYNEVTIGRRVTRSGESDYLINNNQCRLKDIKELLMGTGIGKDAYSIIGQGKVEAILSERSTDRRELFEEAAGISKHKKRKEEAVKKLDNTQQKLQRIEDIITEIERQIDPLEKESQKAKEYQGYQTELEKLEINLLLNRYAELEDKLDIKITNKQQLSYKLTEAKSGVSEYDLRIDNYKERLEKLSNQVNNQKEKIFESKSSLGRIENKLELAQEQGKNLLGQKNRLENEVIRLKDRIKLDQKEINRKTKKRFKLEDMIENKTSALHRKEKELKRIVEKLRVKLESKRKIKDNQLDQINNINNHKYQLESLKKEITRYQEDINSLVRVKNDLTEETNKVKEDKATKEMNLLATKEELAHYKEEYEDRVRIKKELQNKLQKSQQEYEDLKDKINTKSSRLKVLEGMEENYEGYYRGVKNLLKYTNESNKLEGVCGVVAELIETPQKYETAIEVALGSILQNIVVEDDTVGKKAIKYLKDNKHGRATFLPLNLVTPRSLRKKEKEALEVKGAIGIAKDLIEYERKYQSVIDNILGRVVIAKDIDAAIKVSKAANKRIKVVTLKGDIINPGGAMTGGSRNRNNNLLGRSREIEDLSITVRELSNKLKGLEEDGLKKRESLLNLEDKLKELADKIHKLDIQKTTYKKDYQQAEKENKRLKRAIMDKEADLNRLEEKVSKLQSKEKELVENLSQMTDGGADLEGIISTLEEEINTLEEQREEYNSKITDLKVEIASIKQEKESLIEEINFKEQGIKEAQDEIEDKKEEIFRLEEKEEQLEVKKKELSQQKGGMSCQIVDLKEDLDKFRKEKKELKDKVKKYQKESKDIRERFTSLQEEYNQVKIDLGQLEVKLENIQVRLEEEYELEVEQVIEDRKAITNYSKVEGRIKELKRKMKRLHPVNLGAIEEYQTLNQRFNFLQEQHQDLIEGKNSLEEVISEIEEEMEEKFLLTFKRVKEEFETIFIDLFEGGQAQLMLEDENNLLETGIEINAQPPGKNLQKLSLMSGGEKALTATALLFALLRVNPSPFYVLDELDAPLDDANVNRFADYLQRLSEIAQFIVITHRKGTMKAADALYGITMQESGVSKLVSLKLNDLDIN